MYFRSLVRVMRQPGFFDLSSLRPYRIEKGLIYMRFAYILVFQYWKKICSLDFSRYVDSVLMSIFRAVGPLAIISREFFYEYG